MPILPIIYALIASTVFALCYLRIYMRFFDLHKFYYLGFIVFLFSVYIQFFSTILLNINIGYIALLSFLTYPVALALIFKTNVFNIIFLSLNAILKVYVSFIFISTLYALDANVQFTIEWISESSFYHLSQGHAYLFSLLSLFVIDQYLLSSKLTDFFQLKRNLLLIISIQIILIINMIWISVSNQILPATWYNNILLLIAFSVDIIYFLLRLFTANSSYFSAYKIHTEMLSKQLSLQIDHYKNYEEQTNEFLKFKHDYDKILKGISNLLALQDYVSIKRIVNDSNSELDALFTYQKYSNNLILDALLNDYSKRFMKIKANFNAITYITISKMSDVKLIKLFYNILENAYEALLLVPNLNDRLMDIKSEIVENYIKISFVNSMNASIIPTDSKTSKLDKMNHGFGLSIINDVVLEYDGFLNKFVTTKEGLSYYNLEIFIPIS